MAFCLLNARLWIVRVRRGSETCVEISRRRRRRGRSQQDRRNIVGCWRCSSAVTGTTNGRLRAPNLPQCGGGQRAADPPTPTCLTTSREHRLCQDRPGSTSPQTLLGRPHDSALFPVVDYVTASTWTHDRRPRPCYELDGQSGPLTPL